MLISNLFCFSALYFVRQVIDSSKVEKELGWNLTHDFESGIKDTIDWYVNNQEWIEKTYSYGKKY